MIRYDTAWRHSWGRGAADSGYYVMTREWFEEWMYQVSADTLPVRYTLYPYGHGVSHREGCAQVAVDKSILGTQVSAVLSQEVRGASDHLSDL